MMTVKIATAAEINAAMTAGDSSSEVEACVPGDTASCAVCASTPASTVVISLSSLPANHCSLGALRPKLHEQRQSRDGQEASLVPTAAPVSRTAGTEDPLPKEFV